MLTDRDGILLSEKLTLLVLEPPEHFRGSRLSAEKHLFSLYRVNWFAVSFMLLLQDCFQLAQLSLSYSTIVRVKNTLTAGCVKELLVLNLQFIC